MFVWLKPPKYSTLYSFRIQEIYLWLLILTLVCFIIFFFNLYLYMIYKFIYNCYKIIYRYINCIFINNVCVV